MQIAAKLSFQLGSSLGYRQRGINGLSEGQWQSYGSSKTMVQGTFSCCFSVVYQFCTKKWPHTGSPTANRQTSTDSFRYRRLTGQTLPFLGLWRSDLTTAH
jgi:hypothetical protein